MSLSIRGGTKECNFRKYEYRESDGHTKISLRSPSVSAQVGLRVLGTLLLRMSLTVVDSYTREWPVHMGPRCDLRHSKHKPGHGESTRRTGKCELHRKIKHLSLPLSDP